ncbi:hypothetical protein RYX36_015353 [Vicia faba]
MVPLTIVEKKVVHEKRMADRGDMWSANLKSNPLGLITHNEKKRRSVDEVCIISATPISIVKSRAVDENHSSMGAKKPKEKNMLNEAYNDTVLDSVPNPFYFLYTQKKILIISSIANTQRIIAVFILLIPVTDSDSPMATETKAVTEDVKIDLFEDDDEFEEFEINEEWDDKEEGKEIAQQWEDDWDDDDVSDDFSLQLRRELESTTEKN